MNGEDQCEPDKRDEEMVPGDHTPPRGQVEAGQNERVDQEAEGKRRYRLLKRPPRMVASDYVIRMVKNPKYRGRNTRDQDLPPKPLPRRTGPCLHLLSPSRKKPYPLYICQH